MRQSIQPGKDQAVHDPESLPLGQMPALYVNLMPKDQDLGYQRSSRPEQPDQRRPNKAARFPHRTEALRDSASAVSPIRFTTGTGRICGRQRATMIVPIAGLDVAAPTEDKE